MNDLVVDPRLFRAKCMEKDWTRMLEVLLIARFGESTSPIQRYGPLARILAREGNLWLQFGTELGYFGGVDSLSLPFGEPDMLELDQPFQIEVSSYFPTPPAESDENLDPHEFADQLNLAWEDLTRDRIEFLSLLMFAPENEWNVRVSHLEAFAAALENWPQWQPPPQDVAEISWSLRGAESESGAPLYPATWRLGESNDHILEIHGRQVAERWRVVSPVRQRIAAIVEAVTQVERVRPEREIRVLWEFGPEEQA